MYKFKIKKKEIKIEIFIKLYLFCVIWFIINLKLKIVEEK